MYETSARRSSGSGIVRIVSGIFLVIAIILIVHIILVFADASTTSAIVKDIANLASKLAWGFKSLFSFGSAKLTVFVNYGLAALAYLLVGGVLVRLFRSAS
jgi:uncharacterized membrane protein